jgi:hypothetical protein
MFSGGEKNSFFCIFVIGNNTIATLTEKNRNFACSYNVLRYEYIKVLYSPQECGLLVRQGRINEF